jgi:hypothetical protein
VRIAYIGKFRKLWDEEYIARGFESLGHTVGRIDELTRLDHIQRDLLAFKPALVVWAKLQHPRADEIVAFCKANGFKTACWVFDLYWNYPRQGQLATPAFKADHVFTTDGGEHPWSAYGILRHTCVRQGIHAPECYREPVPSEGKDIDVLFVGSFNPSNSERNETLSRLAGAFALTWVGKDDSDECRGPKLNRLLARAKVVVGDSVYSPRYWSNRVVETLGRGGFLIHRDVEGIRDEYPSLVTYDGTYQDLKKKVDFYLAADDERERITQANFEWVRGRYTCEKKCATILASCGL